MKLVSSSLKNCDNREKVYVEMNQEGFYDFLSTLKQFILKASEYISNYSEVYRTIYVCHKATIMRAANGCKLFQEKFFKTKLFKTKILQDQNSSKQNFSRLIFFKINILEDKILQDKIFQEIAFIIK